MLQERGGSYLLGSCLRLMDTYAADAVQGTLLYGLLPLLCCLNPVAWSCGSRRARPLSFAWTTLEQVVGTASPRELVEYVSPSLIQTPRDHVHVRSVPPAFPGPPPAFLDCASLTSSLGASQALLIRLHNLPCLPPSPPPSLSRPQLMHSDDAPPFSPLMDFLATSSLSSLWV